MDNQDEIDAYEQAQEELYAAEQAIIDAAVFVSHLGTWNQNAMSTQAHVLLNRWQELQGAILKWRAVGGQTSDERDDALDMLYGKGTGVKAPAVS